MDEKNIDLRKLGEEVAALLGWRLGSAAEGEGRWEKWARLERDDGSGAVEPGPDELEPRGGPLAIPHHLDGRQVESTRRLERLRALDLDERNGRAIRSRRRSQGVVDRARLLDHVSRGQERQRRLRPQSHEFLDILQ